MKKWLLIFLLTPVFAQGQERSDIGIRYELGSRQFIAAELRIPIANTFKFDVSLGYQPNGPWRNWQDYNRVLQTTDSILSRRFHTYSRQSFELQSGLTYQLPWKYFSISAALTFAFQREYYYNYNEFYKHDPLVSNYYELYPAEHLDKQEAIRRKWNGIQGVRQAFHFHYPIGENWLIGASFAQMVSASFTFRSEVVADPLNEMWFDWIGLNEVIGDTRLTVNIRYRFGKERSFKRLSEKE